jgi:hypothetical protein
MCRIVMDVPLRGQHHWERNGRSRDVEKRASSGYRCRARRHVTSVFEVDVDPPS